MIKKKTQKLKNYVGKEFFFEDDDDVSNFITILI